MHTYYVLPNGFQTTRFNDPSYGTNWVSQYQKGKTNLDFTEARDSEWQWHQLGHICKSAPRSRQITTTTPHLFFTGQMSFLPPFRQQIARFPTKIKTTIRLYVRTMAHYVGFLQNFL